MESQGDEETSRERMDWETLEQERAAQWDDFNVDETVPLLYAPSGMALKGWRPPELPGPWNNIYSNSFSFDGRKPLPDLLGEGEKARLPVQDSCLLL